MGLVIVDLEWQVPSFKVMLKREISMPFRYIMFFKKHFDKENFYEWEMEFTKTQVVSRKEYIQRKKQSQE